MTAQYEDDGPDCEGIERRYNTDDTGQEGGRVCSTVALATVASQLHALPAWLHGTEEAIAQ